MKNKTIQFDTLIDGDISLAGWCFLEEESADPTTGTESIKNLYGFRITHIEDVVITDRKLQQQLGNKLEWRLDKEEILSQYDQISFAN
jgi:hypothetical protein